MPGGICAITNQTNHWNPFDKTKTSFEKQISERRSASEKPVYLLASQAIKIKEHIPTEGFTPSDTTNLQEGQKIEHQKFGFGEVIKMEGAAHNPVATVKFEHNGEKKIMLNYAKLRIVE